MSKTNKEELTLEQSIEILEEMFISEDDKTLYEFILEVLEKPMIEKVMEKTNGNQILAAEILGINQNTLRAKIKRLGG